MSPNKTNLKKLPESHSETIMGKFIPLPFLKLKEFLGNILLKVTTANYKTICVGIQYLFSLAFGPNFFSYLNCNYKYIYSFILQNYVLIYYFYYVVLKV